MKINKKQIVFLSLALVVCIAVYLNWRYLDHIDLGEGNMVAVDTNSNKNQEETVMKEAVIVSAVRTAVGSSKIKISLSR